MIIDAYVNGLPKLWCDIVICFIITSIFSLTSESIYTAFEKNFTPSISLKEHSKKAFYFRKTPPIFIR